MNWFIAGARATNDPFLLAAFWIGCAAAVLICLLIVQIVGLRIGLRARERRSARVVAHWRPLITALLAGVRPDRLPELKREDEIDFFKLWLHFQSSVRGDARAWLNWLGRALGCDRVALRLLAHGDRGERLLAVMVLGHLSHGPAFASLHAMSIGRDALLAVHASMAMAHIDPERAASTLTPAMLADIAWPVREVVNVLQGARIHATPVLLEQLREVGEPLLPRLLQVMHGLRITLPDAELKRLLGHGSVEVRIGVLRMVADPSAHQAIVDMLTDEDWRVRMHAAKALGRVGRREDVPALTGLLSDQQWWVRYRSAQVLAGFPFLKREELQNIALSLKDRYASDMLRQVMAEAKSTT